MRRTRSVSSREPSAPPAGTSTARAWTVLGATVALDSMGIMPAGLVGVLALSISADLGVAATSIGFIVSAFFLAGSASAAAFGPHIDRFGPRLSATLTGLMTSACLAVIAIAGMSTWLVGAACAVAGAAFAITMPATNAVLGVTVPESRRIIAVCAKQTAVPIALGLAAAVITVVDQIGGWRFAFGYAALISLLITGAFYLVSRTRAEPHSKPEPRAPGSGRAAQRAVFRVGVSSMLASLLAGALTGYAAITLHESGMALATAAIVLAVSNAGGILTRLASGWRAQRRRDTSLRTVASMMIAGGVGAFLLATGSPIAAAIGSLVAFSLGWGWSALTYAVILEANLDNPGATGAVIQSGGMAGSGSGPLIMAGLVGYFGLGTGWVVVGLAAVLAGLLLWRYRPNGGG